MDAGQTEGAVTLETIQQAMRDGINEVLDALAPELAGAFQELANELGKVVQVSFTSYPGREETDIEFVISNQTHAE